MANALSTVPSPPRPFTYLPVEGGINIYDANGTRIMKVEGDAVGMLMNGETTPDDVFDEFVGKMAAMEAEYTVSWERVNNPPTFGDLRRLAHHHRLRPLLDQRKRRIAPAPWGFEAESAYHSGPDVIRMCNRLQEIFAAPDGVRPFQEWMNLAIEDMMVIGAIACFFVPPNTEAIGDSAWMTKASGENIAILNPRPYFRLMDASSVGLIVDDNLKPPPVGPFAAQMSTDEPVLMATSNLLYAKRWPVEGKVYGESVIEQLAAKEYEAGSAILRETRDQAMFDTFKPLIGPVDEDREWLAEKVIDELARRVFGETHCRFRWKVA